MISDMARCSAVKAKSGEPCPNAATGDDGLCTGHRSSAKRAAGRADPVNLARMPPQDAVDLVASLATVSLDVGLDPLDILLASPLEAGSVVTVVVTAEVGEPMFRQTTQANTVRVRLRPVAVELKREEVASPPEDAETTRASLERWERKQERLRQQRTGEVSNQSNETVVHGD